MTIKSILCFFLLQMLYFGAYGQQKVLVFSKTEGFRHTSIPAGISALKDLAKTHNFGITHSEDAGVFSKGNLKKYKLVLFLNTSGDVFNKKQQKAFKKYIQNGGSFLGIHAAADTELDWPWFIKLVGASFKNHPKITQARLYLKDRNNPRVSFLPDPWKRTDEWYNYKDINPNIKTLLELDETSYKGGENGQFHPTSWYRELPGGGESLYIGGGHTDEAYAEPNFKEHVLQCILMALQQ